jgi:hypothetical protein
MAEPKPMVHINYDAGLETVFGEGYDPMAKKTTLRYGWEVELGWHTDEERIEFLTVLSERRVGSRYLSDLTVSKHDGSIGGAFDTEIVSLPLVFNESRDALRALGQVVEEFTNKGLTLTGCGVHIHTTKSAIPRHITWRMAQAFTSNYDVMRKWALNDGQKETLLDPGEAQERSDEIHELWNLVSLRRATRYSDRSPWASADALMRANTREHHGMHYRAVAPGQRTPTIEWRVFRAAKSVQVLVSFLEAIDSLRDFSGNPPKGLTLPEKDKGWKDGAFPAEAYVQHVLDNRVYWPELAKRFLLDKFQPYREHVAKQRFNNTARHTELHVGCIVATDSRRQDSDGKRKRLIVTRLIPGDNEVTVKNEKDGTPAGGVAILNIIHLCPGAPSLALEE